MSQFRGAFCVVFVCVCKVFCLLPSERVPRRRMGVCCRRGGKGRVCVALSVEVFFGVLMLRKCVGECSGVESKGGREGRNAGNTGEEKRQSPWT